MFKASTNKKISLALGYVTAIAAGTLVLGPIWGFDGLAQQIFQSITGLSAVVNIYFLGQTSQKITTDNIGVKK
jgi:uncharacterized membrane protein YuzA (DUF378 family)